MQLDSPHEKARKPTIFIINAISRHRDSYSFLSIVNETADDWKVLSILAFVWLSLMRLSVAWPLGVGKSGHVIMIYQAAAPKQIGVRKPAYHRKSSAQSPMCLGLACEKTSQQYQTSRDDMGISRRCG